jgi:hypothetical protein
MSLIKRSLKEWSIYAGIPAKYIKKRSKKILELINLSNDDFSEYIHDNPT